MCIFKGPIADLKYQTAINEEKYPEIDSIDKTQFRSQLQNRKEGYKSLGDKNKVRLGILDKGIRIKGHLNNCVCVCTHALPQHMVCICIHRHM